MDDGDERRGADGDGTSRFVEEYENATEADVIRVEDPADDTEAESSEVGTFAPDIEVTPGRPRLESVVFVALGVYIGLLAIGGMFASAALSSPSVMLGLPAVVAVGAALLYGLFVGTNPDT
jgi:hypothetical protein